MKVICSNSLIKVHFGQVTVLMILSHQITVIVKKLSITHKAT